jgi:hypothetical protein
LKLPHHDLGLLALDGAGLHAGAWLTAVVLGKFVTTLQLILEVGNVWRFRLGDNAAGAVNGRGRVGVVAHLGFGLGVRLLVLVHYVLVRRDGITFLFLEVLLVIAN